MEHIERYAGDVLPRIKLKLKKQINFSRWWFPIPAGIGKFEEKAAQPDILPPPHRVPIGGPPRKGKEERVKIPRVPTCPELAKYKNAHIVSEMDITREAALTEFQETTIAAPQPNQNTSGGTQASDGTQSSAMLKHHSPPQVLLKRLMQDAQRQQLKVPQS
ncbi:hypothetical protein PIB30_079079 [Stylosanthes scabra]|uniref:Uncharacterized protein n=1 Tax=Stylosanthes scabra TaxID=79078 RepID=A0ABU6UUS2_9FABA|nr:hypothetical protein [Stylosanthes scabra]